MTTNERLLAEAREFHASLPHCHGYDYRKGHNCPSLVGDPHEASCPLHGKKELTLFEFATAFAQAIRDEERERCAKVADAMAKEYRDERTTKYV